MTDDNHDTPLNPSLTLHGLDEVIKTGLWFTVPGGNTGLYTGDLFYNMVTKKFRITGIPTGMLGLRHAIKDGENGPLKIDLNISTVLGSSGSMGYATLEFTEALVAGEFMAWMEEWWQGRSVMETARKSWTVCQGTLAWQK